MTLASAFSFAVSAAAGFVLGMLYFVALRETVRSLASGGGWARPLALTLARLAAASAAFAVVTIGSGALAVSALLAGFLIARTVAVRRAGRTL